MSEKILIYGYGNPGRQDDGLGNCFIEKMEDWLKKNQHQHIRTDSNYQLNIEDAANIAEQDIVIFVDASIEDMEGFCLTRVEPSPKVDFTMHSVTPSFVLNLCTDIYDKVPHCFLLHIKGYEWELEEKLTEKATKNLEAAFHFLIEKITQPSQLLEEAECN